MNAELAVSFTLATYGSAWLARDPTVGSDPLHLARFTHGLAVRVSFAGADSPQEWLEALAASGKDRIWLAIPDLQAPTRHAWHRRAAFAGGLPAGVLTTSRRGSTLWTASWNVSNTAGRRAWNVAYHGTDADFEPQRPPVEHAAAGLDAALAHAEEFATRLRLGPWHTIFRQARRHPPPRSSPGSLFPDGSYSTASRRLMAMADAAWVFGGMGSWNDLPYLGADANAEYEQISHDLFSAIMSAYIAAANSDVSARA